MPLLLENACPCIKVGNHKMSLGITSPLDNRYCHIIKGSSPHISHILDLKRVQLIRISKQRTMTLFPLTNLSTPKLLNLLGVHSWPLLISSQVIRWVVKSVASIMHFHIVLFMFHLPLKWINNYETFFLFIFFQSVICITCYCFSRFSVTHWAQMHMYPYFERYGKQLIDLD